MRRTIVSVRMSGCQDITRPTWREQNRRWKTDCASNIHGYHDVFPVSLPPSLHLLREREIQLKFFAAAAALLTIDIQKSPRAASGAAGVEL